MKKEEVNFLSALEAGLVTLALSLGYTIEEIRATQKSDQEGSALTWSDNPYNQGLGRVKQPVLMLVDAQRILIEAELQLKSGLKLTQALQAGELKFKKPSTKKD